MKTKRLTTREQYQLAHRFNRLRMFDEVSSFYAEQTARSFGISPTILKAVFKIPHHSSEVSGWSTFGRQMDFEELREQAHFRRLVDIGRREYYQRQTQGGGDARG